MAKNSRKIKPTELNEKILANNHAISVMLQVNEELYNQLADEGMDAPSGKDLIRFPAGRVRTLKEINSLYHLPEIIRSKTTIDNAGYCLQACEIYRFLTERMGIYALVKKMMYKDWFLCLLSVMEALVDTSSKHLDIGKGGFQNKVSNKEYRKIVGLSSESAEQLRNIYEQRNSIHLERNDVSKIEKLNFEQTDIENAEKALGELAELLYKNAVPNYKE